jgi:hypothetical protein
MNYFTWGDFKICIEAFSRGSTLFSGLRPGSNVQHETIIDGAIDDQASCTHASQHAQRMLADFKAVGPFGKNSDARPAGASINACFERVAAAGA